jgi:hypothetical protein
MPAQQGQQTTPETPEELRLRLTIVTLFVAVLTLTLALLAVVFWGVGIALAVLVVGGAVCTIEACAFMQSWWREQRRSDQALQQADIALLEAELGLPVTMVGECWSCHKPLAAGAKFCTYCGKMAEQPTAKVCATCQTRNPLDGVYCSECGKRLPEMA